MIDDDNCEQKVDQGAGLGAVTAITGALLIVALIAANTSRIDINFIVYSADQVPLWWYTIIIVGLTIVTDRVLRFVIRHRKKNKKNDNG